MSNSAVPYAFFPLPLSLQTSSFAAKLAARTPLGGVHKDDKDCVDDSIIPPLPEAGLQELQNETKSTSTTTSSGPVLWPSDSDITYPLPEEDDSQSEAELQEAKKETTTMESFEWPLWLKRFAQKVSTGGNKQHNLRQIWGEKMPSQPPPATTAPQQPRSILKNSTIESPVVNPNHLIGDASSRGALNANVAFDELRLLMIGEQPLDKKCNSDVQRKLTQSSRKKSSYECLSGELPHQGFESFISTLSTPSTGTFQDAKKRHVPTMAETKGTQPQKNDSWGELDQSSKRNPRSSNPFSRSANSYMLSAANKSSVTNDAIGQVQVDLLPSTGSFMDGKKGMFAPLRYRIKNGTESYWQDPLQILSTLAQIMIPVISKFPPSSPIMIRLFQVRKGETNWGMNDSLKRGHRHR